MAAALRSFARDRRRGRIRGIASVCSAHPLVLRAALRFGRDEASPVLIEATCNQVNHRGGYTGMRPAGFAALVARIAAEEGCPHERVRLGGDHLGPNPWRDRPAEEAMAEAERMVAAYVAAGFGKLHLDTSMGCLGEPAALDDETTAARAVRLAAAAEAAAAGSGYPLPVYVIGTEVPPPGGADHSLIKLEPTDPEAARRTIAVHRRAFAEAGLPRAFARVIALVVQPGVEFGNRNVILYDRTRTAGLTLILNDEPQFVFEAHSTDYQSTAALSGLVEDGFAILKVGPELTFVLREALYGLDLIASELDPDYGMRPLAATMEALMLTEPRHWQRHYGGDEADKRILRHYSLSDRIRYYWTDPKAEAAVARLFGTLAGRSVPAPLFRQHLPGLVGMADLPFSPEVAVIRRITESLKSYHAACAPRDR
ncbi:MAG: D-tagatose-bisphosphate aldolase, class II, non-catalytic subunit [Paracoccaceae bacterium]